MVDDTTATRKLLACASCSKLESTLPLGSKLLVCGGCRDQYYSTDRAFHQGAECESQKIAKEWTEARKEAEEIHDKFFKDASAWTKTHYEEISWASRTVIQPGLPSSRRQTHGLLLMWEYRPEATEPRRLFELVRAEAAPLEALVGLHNSCASDALQNDDLSEEGIRTRLKWLPGYGVHNHVAVCLLCWVDADRHVVGDCAWPTVACFPLEAKRLILWDDDWLDMLKASLRSPAVEHGKDIDLLHAQRSRRIDGGMKEMIEQGFHAKDEQPLRDPYGRLTDEEFKTEYKKERKVHQNRKKKARKAAAIDRQFHEGAECESQKADGEAKWLLKNRDTEEESYKKFFERASEWTKSHYEEMDWVSRTVIQPGLLSSTRRTHGLLFHWDYNPEADEALHYFELGLVQAYPLEKLAEIHNFVTNNVNVVTKDDFSEGYRGQNHVALSVHRWIEDGTKLVGSCIAPQVVGFALEPKRLILWDHDWLELLQTSLRDPVIEEGKGFKLLQIQRLRREDGGMREMVRQGFHAKDEQPLHDPFGTMTDEEYKASIKQIRKSFKNKKKKERQAASAARKAEEQCQVEAPWRKRYGYAFV
ncbi:hypothetical protein MNV49_004717 [Pseudohyphozyma bogoriensis]|nr:hypothetical protein MNV49_004717 [Pseudohyphozyma bogoriensis]